MSEAKDAAALDAARRLREDAWTLVRGDAEALRDGLVQKPVGQRIKEHATGELVDAFEQARTVAADNKAVVVGTLALLAGWFLRGPIGRTAVSLTARYRKGEHDD